jgi:hypothetical protein
VANFWPSVNYRANLLAILVCKRLPMFSINPQVSWLTLFFVGSIHMFVGKLAAFLSNIALVGELSLFFLRVQSPFCLVKSKNKAIRIMILSVFCISILHICLTYLSYIFVLHIWLCGICQIPFFGSKHRRVLRIANWTLPPEGCDTGWDPYERLKVLDFLENNV